MPCVAKAYSTLIGTFVAAVLQAYHILSRSQLLIREIANVLVCFFWPNGWLPMLTSLLGNKTKNLLALSNSKNKKEELFFAKITFLPRDCRQITTEFKFCLSQRSTVWKVSWAGTPRALAASKNALIFSIHLNARVVLLIFLTEPSLMSLTSLKKKKQKIFNSLFSKNVNFFPQTKI